MSRCVWQIAGEVIQEAGRAGGIDEVRRIAEKGWPGHVGGEKPSEEILKAIQTEARMTVEQYDLTMKEMGS